MVNLASTSGPLPSWHIQLQSLFAQIIILYFVSFPDLSFLFTYGFIFWLSASLTSFLLGARSFALYLVAYWKYLHPYVLVLCSKRQLLRNYRLCSLWCRVSSAFLLKAHFSDYPIQCPVDYKVFYCGEQESKSLTALCELQWRLPLLLSGSPFSSCSSFLPCKQQHSACLEGTSRALYALFLCSSPLSHTLPYELHPFWPLWTPRSVSQLREISGLCHAAPSRSCNLESLSRHQLGPLQDSIHFPSLRDPCPASLVVQCMKTVVLYTVAGLSDFLRESISSSCSESKRQNHFWRQDFYCNVNDSF